MASEEQRDPRNVHHPMTRAEFQAHVPAFVFSKYFKKLKVPAFDSLNVNQPDFFKALNEVLSQSSMADIAAYLRWKLISRTAPHLSSAFANESFNFFGRVMNGLEEQKPRWKRVVSTVDSALGEAIGEFYVARYFPPQAKARVMTMIENGKTVMRQALQDAPWMSDETKVKLLHKLDKTVWKIGYPDKWRDYSPLEIDGTSYVRNVLEANRFHVRLDLMKIGQLHDRNEWYMSPQTVNAYADSQSNQIVFPAAMIQRPFFDFLADDAFNYGGILFVILHEFGDLFDDSGALFDADGNLIMQWTERDYANFMLFVEMIRLQYGRFSVGPVYLKGKKVSGEAIGDLNGATLAYRALQLALEKTGRTVDANGFSDEQRFFIALGQIWAMITTPEAAEQLAMTDFHPPAQFRVEGTLANLSEFPKAFGLPDDCQIMLPPEERCHMW